MRLATLALWATACGAPPAPTAPASVQLPAPPPSAAMEGWRRAVYSDLEDIGARWAIDPVDARRVTERLLERGCDPGVSSSSATLRALRNTIFAMHGYTFTGGAELHWFFGHEAWYQPNAAFNESNPPAVSKVEAACVDRLKKAEGTLPPFDVARATVPPAPRLVELPAWIIPVGSYTTEAEARRRAAALDGFRTDHLWAPEVANAGTARQWVAYVGPVPYADRDSAAQLLARVRAVAPEVRAIKVGPGPPEDIAP